jgi:hypothetical protein
MITIRIANARPVTTSAGLREFAGGRVPYAITLLPAGHIFGSAMSLIEAEGASLLYTGDFKLRKGLSAEPCEPQHADLLIMETTYGRPEYRFPPTEAVMQGVIRFCKEALDNDETPVLLGYSLGKSQELLCGLGDAALPEVPQPVDDRVLLALGDLQIARLGLRVSAQAFDLTPFEMHRGEILELGRASIAPAHRNLAVLQLLWRGIAFYAQAMGTLRFIPVNEDDGHGARPSHPGLLHRGTTCTAQRIC